MTKRSFSLALALISTVLISCEKNPVDPGTDPAPSVKNIEVAFSENGVQIASVDSVTATFKLPGSINTTTKKLTVSGSKYVTSAQDLSPATYQVEFTVYVKKVQPGIGYSYIYKIKKNIALPLQTADITQGPNGNYSGTWAPYFMFHEAARNVTLIVAERVDDPYFEVRAPQLVGYKLSSLDRSTFGGGTTATYLVENETWVSPNNPYLSGVYFDTNTFAAFSEKMKSKEWYRGEFSFHLDEGTNSIIHFDHVYYKRP